MMILDKKKCLSCGGCIPVCPVAGNEFHDPELIFNENCIECGLCEKVCPVGAIRREENETAEK